MPLSAQSLIRQIITDCNLASHPSNHYRYVAAKRALELEQCMGNYPANATAYDYAVDRFARAFLDGGDAR